LTFSTEIKIGHLFLKGYGKTPRESREDLIKMVEVEESLEAPDRERILKVLKEVV